MNRVGADKLMQTCHSNTSANMAIDDMVEVTVGNEMFKRKVKGDYHAVTCKKIRIVNTHSNYDPETAEVALQRRRDQ